MSAMMEAAFDQAQSPTTLMAIESRRREIGLSRCQLERHAQMSNNYYYKLLRGEKSASPEVLASLRLALSRYHVTPTVDYSTTSVQINMLIRLAVALLCETSGVNAELVQNSDAKRRATQSSEWMAAARIRRHAWALVNSAFGIKGADLARAAGLSKASISLALKAVEDERDDPDFDREMDRLERALTGGGW